MQPRWTKPNKAALAVTLSLMGQGALAETLPTSDLHLPFVPRTEDERARIAAITTPATEFTAPEAFEGRPGGAGTVADPGDDTVFTLPPATLPFESKLDFELGNALFAKLWVSSPSSTKASDGLGPLYNARSCQRCHVNDGRGHPPEHAEDDRTSMFLRLSAPAGDAPLTALEAYLADLDGAEATERTRPLPGYGSQLQDLSLAGFAPEGRMEISYEEIAVSLSAGEVITLRKPLYSISNPAFGALPEEVQISPRVANQMIGLGLLEAIPAEDILAHADPDDADGDGISGRPNLVWSKRYDQVMLGRFGWKAGEPTVEEQSAAAFHADIGISSPLFPEPSGDCTPEQVACLNAPNGAGDARGDEIDQTGMDLVTFYARNLAVPARRDMDDPEVLRGKEIFHDTGCAACHTPKYVTARLEGAENAPQSFQLIWPYTDLLLHDMGEGLADDRPEARATGREWRTAPLWGIGLTARVSGHTTYLHDGRARSLLEAVLWHGGEAQSARDTVVEMPPEDRAALIRFLESL
ncbi:di-heme oxidoredictase family protein [Celeribacter sp. SCSIO 80788]|uniref:di-heme oxidoreductase family protein n=1 Tax=Celeribacter sp. SCSIO 80788 TaxID=3117013 RepID=UPI003DA63E74